MTINSGVVLNIYGQLITTTTDTLAGAVINNGAFNPTSNTSLTFSSTFTNTGTFTLVYQHV